MKQFVITKTGYSAGVYGCSAEYFTCVIVNSKGISGFRFYGMYGAEERVSRALVDKGYEPRYVGSEYGKVLYREGTKYSKTEKQALEEVKNNY